MTAYECSVCGFIFDEEQGGEKWDRLADDWVCPVCGSGKSYFKRTAAPSQPVQVGGGTGKKQVICSVCGYIAGAGHTEDLCPACGAPKTAFRPYEDKVSLKRRKILDLHLHHMIVHFPQAFSIVILFLIFVAFFFQGIKSELMTTSKVLSIFLPLSAAASIISGWIDGKTRFKQTNTPILKRKIFVGILFLVFSIGILLILNFSNLLLPWRLVLFSLATLCALSSLFLGYNGGRLAGLTVPG